MARYSDDMATQSSVSATTAGLQAMGSRRMANPPSMPMAKVKNPSSSTRARSNASVMVSPSRIRQDRNPAATSESFSVWKLSPTRSSRVRSWLWLDRDPLWTRQVSAPVAKGWEPLVVTADSVAIRVWAMA